MFHLVSIEYVIKAQYLCWDYKFLRFIVVNDIDSINTANTTTNKNE